MPKNDLWQSNYSHAYFEALFNNTVENCMLLLDEKGTIISINTAFQHHFGYHENDIIGKPLYTLFINDDIVLGKPANEIQKVLTTGQCSDNNYMVRKDKSITWVSGESIKVKSDDGAVRILKIIQDINVQKKSQDDLIRLDKLTEKILNSVEDAIVILDLRLNILSVNESCKLLFNLKFKSGSLLNFGEILLKRDVSEKLIDSIKGAARSKVGFSNLSIEIGTPNKEKKVYDVSCNPMEYQRDDVQMVIIFHDITVHKLLEREREDVIGFVAHELRNPLANLVLCNELMGDLVTDNDREAMKDILKRSKNNVMRLNKLVTELYDAAKMNSGNLKLDISTFSFEEMIWEAVDTIKVLHPLYNIIVTGDGKVLVSGDKHRLIQVVTNFLSNGIKYSDGQKEVMLNITYDKDAISVSVKDKGLGIAARHLPFIFDRFFRAENTQNLEGIGLGLFLCRQIINAHHGKIWAESQEGKGSTFYFSIPRS